MDRLKKRVWQPFFALLLVIGSIATVTTPAQAAVTWHDFERNCGTFFTLTCDVQYTGTYPGGQVRAIGTQNMYEVGLEVSSNQSDWVIIATTTGTTTAAKPVNKYGWYRGCVKTVSGGAWLCPMALP